MKIKVNKNILWTNLLTIFFVKAGIKFACISPGSRSTPLTFSIASEKKIKSFPIVDERSSAFFALGLSKASDSPVVIVTTSGTATAELYPAIIEAYQSRIPLIICTADRPAYLRNTGSNQTINQKNIYKNHIRYFAEISLPSTNKKNIKTLLNQAAESLFIAKFKDRGPVHLNFQFEKPFEPDSITDEVNDNIISFAYEYIEKLLLTDVKVETKPIENFSFEQVSLITVGAGKTDKEFLKLIDKFSSSYNIPVFADVNSGLRFSNHSIKNLISNYEALVKNSFFKNKFKFGKVLHFGRNLTSQSLEDYIVKSKAKRIVVNEFGDRFDSTRKAEIIKYKPKEFIHKILQSGLKKSSVEIFASLKVLDKKIESIKQKIFSSSLNEVNIILELVGRIPAGSNLYVGNSLPVRDLDFFSSRIENEIRVYQNRGASGIDGIISSALGVALASKKETYLVIGDLSFYYDLNSLMIAKQFEIPLKIILINNNGGAIFNYLPISKSQKIFDKYFLTPVHYDIKKICEAFGANYKLVKSLNEYKKSILSAKKTNSCLILEVKTNSLFTKQLKDKFWNLSKEIFW
ncbi:2-succinyl-5-enolpyruvyl-6-hydroxy-3-cyclohexene-1-carboxylic-acid synthase [Ignavibacterium sp.]|uniref:2-succinyl-5-enolpyruvyl-6-hydroxy-3- cyclohexene-1-carboxylic-acid synthase n=1 Tax=Ignavibacterium sp. TaxID=2651167 RepID=UPI00307F08FD